MKIKPKILVLSLAYHPLIGGAELAAASIMEQLREEYSFTVLTYRFFSHLPKREIIDGIEVVRIGWPCQVDDHYGHASKKILFALEACWTGWRLLRGQSYRCLWLMMAGYPTLTALWLRWLTKTPIVLTLQEGDSEEVILKRVGRGYFLWQKIFKQAAHITTISASLGDLARKHGAAAEKVSLIPNGVDETRLEPTLNKHEGTVLVTVSRLVHKNGIDILIEAFHQIASQYEKLSLNIVGDGPLRSDLEKQAQQGAGHDRINFLGEVGFLDIHSYLQAADIFIRPSRSEGLGTAFLEAMACGLVVIGTPVGGIPDFLKDGQTGLMVATDDPAALVKAIEQLIIDPELRQRISKQGRQLVLDRYRWSLLAGSLQAIFNRLFYAQQGIVLASPIFPPLLGGPALHAQKLLETLRAAGHPVTIVTYTPRLLSLPKGWRHFYLLLWLWWQSRRAKLIYAFDAWSVGWPAALVAKWRNLPLIIRIGGDLAWERYAEQVHQPQSMLEWYKNGAYHQSKIFLMSRKVMKQARKIIVPANILQDLLIKYYDLSMGQISMITNPLPSPEITMGQAIKPTVLFAGRFVSYKNLIALIEAMAIVQVRQPQASLRLIGTGPEEKYLKNYIQEKDWANFISIEPPLPHQKILEEIAAAGVVVSPSLTDFSPNMILEAIAQEVPILISRENGLGLSLPEIFLVSAHNKTELAQKIDWLLSHRDEALSEVKLLKQQGINWTELGRKQLSLIHEILLNR